MIYYKYILDIEEEFSELLMAHLSQLPFEAFEEKEGSIEAWLSEDHDRDQMNLDLMDLKERIPINWEVEKVLPQNWNALWEASHQAISIEDFCQVRADFHKKAAGMTYDIIINPKMAFGTAHHETTYMMILQMREIAMAEKSVLDLGCGTGVLAILAAKMGAQDILAVDVDKYSHENTLENLEVNGLVDQVKTQWATLKHVDHPPFDIILANINRKVILDSLPALHKQLKQGGKLLVSGILNSDKQLVIEQASLNNFTVDHIESKNGWICVLFING